MQNIFHHQGFSKTQSFGNWGWPT